MTYQINYTKGNNTYCVFDIEYYMEHSEIDKEEWFSEIHCLPIVKGLTYFLVDNHNEISFVDFINDSEKIQEIRALLYEKFNNKPKKWKDANNFHYHEFGKVLRAILDQYCEKYKLNLNID